jgi:pyruvate/2-oxoglutarate dehydrogenase complex dihydrolipoamide dehydrogenase (E3) component
MARFTDARTIEIEGGEGQTSQIRADTLLIACETRPAENPLIVTVAHVESGKTVKGDALLYAVGRQANSDLLRLEAAGIAADARGKIAVNENFQTSVPHVYAAGDVIGFPALPATSMEQGRLACFTR